MSRVQPQGELRQKAEKVGRDFDYMLAVRWENCCACGRSGPNDAHHCRDLPDFGERGLYERLPGAATKSGDHDTIPLCTLCHWMFHNRRSEFHDLYGKDYGYIAPTRATLGYAEIDF